MVPWGLPTLPPTTDAKEPGTMIYTERMEVEAKYFGLVIGRGHSGLRHLASMPGITAVDFDPRSSWRSNVQSWPLRVQGTSRKACLAALDHVGLRIVKHSKYAVRFPVISWLLLPKEIVDGQLLLRPVQQAAEGDIIVRCNNDDDDDDRVDVFFIADIQSLRSIKQTRISTIESNSSVKHWAVQSGAVNPDQFRISSYNRAELVSVLERLLADEYKEEQPKGTVWCFRAAPGQEFFLGNRSEDEDVYLNIKAGKIHQADMNNQKIRPFFGDIFVADQFRNGLVCELVQQGYRLAESCVNKFTHFRLMDAREQILAQVTLDNNEYSEEEEKKENVTEETKERIAEEEEEDNESEQPSMKTRSGRREPTILSVVTQQ